MTSPEGEEARPGLSVVIPARDEEASIADTLVGLQRALEGAGLDYELIVVDDGSLDATSTVVRNIASADPRVRLAPNPPPHGFGLAVRHGLDQARGEAVIPVMADGSDSPEDVVRLYSRLRESDVDMVFGSRFVPGARVEGYPAVKRFLNCVGNVLVSQLMRIDYNDFTNPFKLYRHDVIRAIQPLDSESFDLSLEMSVRATARGFSFVVVSNDWYDRTGGESKFRLFRDAARYLRVLWKNRAFLWGR